MDGVKIEPLIIGNLTARIPVIQGGMGVGISLSGLAGAVAAEGGIGVISAAQIGYREADFDKDPIGCNLRAIKKEIDKARQIANGGIIGVNIMTATKRYEDYVRAAVQAGADLIISGAGLPVDLPKYTEGSETKIVPVISSLKSAQVIMRYWMKKYKRLPDAIVIEGPFAGGHLGFTKEQAEHPEELQYDEEVKKILLYVRKMEKAYCLRIPVIMAGGIYTREDMEHYLAMGISGVQMATRFVAAYECDADEAYKQSYINARKEDIVIVQSPVGMPGRAIMNSFLHKAEKGKIPHERCHSCIRACNPAETPYCITEALVNAATGHIEDALLFCGANAWRVEKLEHVKDIMKEFATDECAACAEE